MPAPAAPLEAHDTDRARALKAKIRDRVSDVRRHLIALRAAMAEFGEDFDLDVFQAAYDSEDPVELNCVKAVERGVDQLYNYMPSSPCSASNSRFRNAEEFYLSVDAEFVRNSTGTRGRVWANDAGDRAIAAAREAADRVRHGQPEA